MFTSQSIMALLSLIFNVNAWIASALREVHISKKKKSCPKKKKNSHVLTSHFHLALLGFTLNVTTRITAALRDVHVSKKNPVPKKKLTCVDIPGCLCLASFHSQRYHSDNKCTSASHNSMPAPLSLRRIASAGGPTWGAVVHMRKSQL